MSVFGKTFRTEEGGLTVGEQTAEYIKKLKKNPYTKPMTRSKMVRDGPAGVLDAELVQEKIEHKRKLMGATGYRLSAKTFDGQVYQGSLEFGGRQFMPNSRGEFVVINSGKLKDDYKSAIQQQDYINKVAEYCLLGDDYAKDILQLDDKLTICKKNSAQYINGDGDTEDLTDFLGDLSIPSCQPSLMDCLDPSSIAYSSALAKMKKIIEFVAPIIEDDQEDISYNEAVNVQEKEKSTHIPVKE